MQRAGGNQRPAEPLTDLQGAELQARQAADAVLAGARPALSAFTHSGPLHDTGGRGEPHVSLHHRVPASDVERWVADGEDLFFQLFRLHVIRRFPAASERDVIAAFATVSKRAVTGDVAVAIERAKRADGLIPLEVHPDVDEAIRAWLRKDRNVETAPAQRGAAGGAEQADRGKGVGQGEGQGAGDGRKLGVSNRRGRELQQKTFGDATRAVQAELDAAHRKKTQVPAQDADGRERLWPREFSDPEQRELILGVMKQIVGEPTTLPKEEESRVPAALSAAEAALLLKLAKLDDETRAAVIAKLRGGGQLSPPSGQTLAETLESAIASVEVARHAKELRLDLSPTSAQPLVDNRPVRGRIVNESGALTPGERSVWKFRVDDDRTTAWGVAHISISWLALLLDRRSRAPIETVSREYTGYMPTRDQGILNDSEFDFTVRMPGSYLVKAIVQHNFFRPAYFEEPFVVEEEFVQSERLFAEQNLGLVETESGWTEEYFDHGGDFLYRVGRVRRGTLQADAHATTDAELIASIEEQKKLIRENVAAVVQRDPRRRADLEKARDERLKELDGQIQSLRANAMPGAVPLVVRGQFTSRTRGVQDAAMQLACSLRAVSVKQPDGSSERTEFRLTLHDTTPRASRQVFHWDSQASSVVGAQRELFLQIAEAYPFGTVNVLFQGYDSATHRPTPDFVQFEKRTDTVAKDLKHVIFDEAMDTTINVVGMVLSILPPTAAIGVTLLVAYNSSKALADNIDDAETGNFRKEKAKIALADLVLNLLPLAPRIVKVGRAAYYVIEGASIVGGVALMTAVGLDQVRELRVGRVDELVRKKQELMRLNPAHPAIVSGSLQREIDELSKQIATTTEEVFFNMAGQAVFLQVASTAVGAGLGNLHAPRPGTVTDAPAGKTEPAPAGRAAPRVAEPRASDVRAGGREPAPVRNVGKSSAAEADAHPPAAPERAPERSPSPSDAIAARNAATRAEMTRGLDSGRLVGGGEAKVTAGGKVAICQSPCQWLRDVYGRALAARPELEARVRRIEQDAARARDLMRKPGRTDAERVEAGRLARKAVAETQKLWAEVKVIDPAARVVPSNGVVNVGGNGEVEGALNLNPIVPNTGGPSIDVPGDWVPLRFEDMGEVFPPGSVQSIVSRKLPVDKVDWPRAAAAAKMVKTPDATLELHVYGQLSSAELDAIVLELRNAGFGNAEGLAVGNGAIISTAPGVKLLKQHAESAAGGSRGAPPAAGAAPAAAPHPAPGAEPTAPATPAEPKAPALFAPPVPARLEPRTRRLMEAELVGSGRPREGLRSLSDSELAAVHRSAQVELLPKRLDELRSTLPEHAQAELDSLRGAPDRHAPIDAAMEARLSKALDLPVRVDPSLPTGEVRVHYEVGPLGNVSRIEIRAGRGATLSDLLLHAPTVGALKRYESLAGVFYRMYDAVELFIRGGGRLPLGSTAHDAWREMQKLPGLIQSRRERLMKESLDPAARLSLLEEIDQLEAQLARHMDALEDMVPGLGFIAGAPKGKGAAEAKRLGYPEAEPGYSWRRDAQSDKLVYQATRYNLGAERRAYDAINRKFVQVEQGATATTLDAIRAGYPPPPAGHHYYDDAVSGYQLRLNPGEAELGTPPLELAQKGLAWEFQPRTEGGLPVIQNRPYRTDVEVGQTSPQALASTPERRRRLEALLAERAAASTARDESRAKLPSAPDPNDAAAMKAWREREDVQSFLKLANEVALASSKLGTFAADVHVKDTWPSAKRIYPKDDVSRSGDFDRVYEIPPDRYVVVEAKGGGGTLASRRVSPHFRAKQGTKEYFESIIDSMSRMGGDAKKTAALLEAAGRQNITYLHVEVPLGATRGAGGALQTVVEGVKVRAFDISQPGIAPTEISTPAETKEP